MMRLICCSFLISVLLSIPLSAYAGPLLTGVRKATSFDKYEPGYIYLIKSGLFSYSVDLGLWREEEAAVEHFQVMKANHPVLKKYKMYIKKMDLGHWGKGIAYRLRIGDMRTQKEADIVCRSLREDGYQKKCDTQFDPD